MHLLSHVCHFLALALLGFFRHAFGAEVNCIRQPQPRSVPCGLRGKLRDAQVTLAANPSTASSLDSCRDLCIRRGCTLFSLDEATNVCNMYSYFGNSQNLHANTSSPTIFYSSLCFECDPQACPLKPDPTVNLIDNGGLEASNKYIGPWSAQGGDGGFVNPQAAPVQPGVNSSNALFVPAPDFFTQSYRHCPGKVHRVEFEIFNVTQTADPILHVDVGSYQRGYFSIPIQKPPGRPARKFVRFYTATHSTGAISMSAQTLILSNSSFSFDNVVIRPVDYTRAKTIGAEQVVNGGFQSGLKPWTYSAETMNNKTAGKFKLAVPGPYGSGPPSKALKWAKGSKEKFGGVEIRLIPEVNAAAIRPGKLHRLTFEIKPRLGMSLEFSDGSTVSGSSTDDYYFYAEDDVFPITISVKPSGFSRVTFDQLSIREIQDEAPVAQNGHGSSKSNGGDPSSTSNNSSGTNVGAIAGGVVGGVICLVLIALLVWFIRHRKRRQTEPQQVFEADDNREKDMKGAVYELPSDAAPLEMSNVQSPRELTGSQAAWEVQGSKVPPVDENKAL